jgi:hypothetical protein
MFCKKTQLQGSIFSSDTKVGDQAHTFAAPPTNAPSRDAIRRIFSRSLRDIALPIS